MNAVITPTETHPVKKKKKQPSRTASLNRPYDTAIQVNVGKANLSVVEDFHIISQRSSTPIS